MSRPQSLNCSQATKDALVAGNYLKWGATGLEVAPFTTDAAVASGSTRNLVEMYLAGNASVTSLTQNAWSLVAGTWTNSLTKGTQLASDANGRVTYTGSLPAILWVSSSISMGPVSGGSDVDLHMAIFKNGVKVASTELVFAASANRTQSTQMQGFVSVVTNDYLECKVMNADSNTDSTVGYSNTMCLVTALA